MRTLRVLGLALLLAAVFQAGAAMAKTTTWTGAVSADWSEAGNWDCGGCAGDPFPENGDTISFDSNSADNLTMTNDLSLTGVNLVLTDPAGKVFINGNSLGLSSAGVNMSASTRDMRINAPLSLSAATAMAINSSNSLELTTVSRAGGIAQSGGHLILSGANTYSGATSIGTSGTLKLAVGATLASPAISVNSGVIEFSSKDQLTGKPSLHLAPNGVYYSPDYQTVGSLTGSGTIRYSCGYYIVVDNDSDCEFIGDVEAKPYCGWFGTHEPNFIKQGSGTLITSVGQRIGGTAAKRHFTVNQGRLRSRLTHFYASVHINSGASFHALWASTFWGDFNLNAGSFWDLYMLNSQISAPSDVIDCYGEINLAGSLRINENEPAYKPGQEIVFIYNATGNPVNGTFAGLPEGATINIKGRPYRISYVGGDGNDVSLTAPAAPGPSIISASTGTTGSYVDVRFDMAMDTAKTGWGQLRVEADSAHSGTASRAYQHNTLLRLFLENPVGSGQVVTLGHEINYRKSPRDTGGALLAAFTDFPVTNNVGGAPAGPPVLAAAATDAAGAIIEARFGKAMADPNGKHGQFSVTNGGAANPCTAAALKPGDNTVIQLTLTNAIAHGQAVTLAYAAGDVQSADAQALAGFGPVAVSNNVGGGGGDGDDGGDDDSDGDNEQPAPEKPKPPQVKQGASVCPGLYPDKVMLNWGAAISQAKSYKIYRADSPLGEKTLLGQCKTTSYEDLIAEPGRRYYYWISQVIGNKESALSSYIVGWRYDKNPGRLGSFSGSGQAELLWWGVETNELVIWRMSGAQLADTISWGPIVMGQRELLRAVADFNGDGQSDLLWCDLESKEVKLWLLGPCGGSETNDNLPSGVARQLSLGKIEHDLFCVHTGDFNGDGKTDLLWRDMASGLLTIWHIDGEKVIERLPITLRFEPGDPSLENGPQASGSLEWELQGLGDFNHDAKADILWRNPNNGRLMIWHMDGAEALSGKALNDPAWQGWRIKGLGDFNASLDLDLLWRNQQDGQLRIWLMERGGLKENAVPIGGEPLPDWRLKGLGDLDGDCMTDLLWLDRATGAVHIWLMDGLNVTCPASPGIAPDYQ
jgi:uncharacterized repeat protein (TIGR02059 family)